MLTSDQAAQEATRYDDLGASTLWSSSALSASEEVRLAHSHLHPHYRRGQMIYYAHKNHIKISMSPTPYSWFVHFLGGICIIIDLDISHPNPHCHHDHIIRIIDDPVAAIRDYLCIPLLCLAW